MKTTILTLALAVSLAVLAAAGAPDEAADPHELLLGKLLGSAVVDGTVDYRAIKARANELDSYLSILNSLDVDRMSRAQKLAFWINAYNAFTLKLILENYPVASIRDIPSPWKTKRWQAGGGTYSLDEIEHTFLRGELKEPRIHFAIVCASIGCPDLWRRAYSADKIDEQLDAAARRFMQSPKHVTTTSRRGLLGRPVPVLKISSIFRWFKDDFKSGDTGTVADFVARYASPPVRAVIEESGQRLEIEYLPYDWGLNGK